MFELLRNLKQEIFKYCVYPVTLPYSILSNEYYKLIKNRKMEDLKNTTTQFVSINANYDKAFNYLTNPMLYKEWSTNFISDILIEGGQHFAITPMGKVRFIVKGDKQTGNIDLFFGDMPHPIPTRILKNGNGVTYLFTLFQADGMPDMAWEQGIKGLIEELEILKTCLEK